jgi:hypothetical protein
VVDTSSWFSAGRQPGKARQGIIDFPKFKNNAALLFVNLLKDLMERQKA